MTEIVIIIIFVVVVIVMGVCGYYREKKNWNNGACPHCNNGFYKSFDMDSSGAVGYNCTNCKSSIWISYSSITDK